MHWHVFKMATSKSSMRSFVFWFCYRPKKATDKTLHKKLHKKPANPYVITSSWFRRQPFLSRCSFHLHIPRIFYLKNSFIETFITKSNLKIIVMQANWLFLFNRNLLLKLTELFFRKSVSLSFITSKNLLSKHPKVKQQFKAFFSF